jgi:hypothetical protein
MGFSMKTSDVALPREMPGNRDRLDVAVLGEFAVAGVQPGDAQLLLDPPAQLRADLGQGQQLALGQ